MSLEEAAETVRAAAGRVFGERVDQAAGYVELLERHGIERGLIGPREVERLWERHVLNSAVIGEQMPPGARVVDVGSGAGLPGVPLAIARPDLDIVLLEPMARRVDWLAEVAEKLELPIAIIRGRAEEPPVREQLGGADIVTARAVAPLARLADWCLPLVRPDGFLVALKGASAADEIERDGAAIRKAGGADPLIVECGAAVLEIPSTVVKIRRLPTASKPKARSRKR
ncbi:glucose inhibited division protein B [Amycolatopsis mediterranei S699]|uniref:Ribosomal RNA small subunit methyltransferase G n=2 Tax=Amycolatopsis mediterranei TaxID=33910 RepID=A0A0H3DN17_AMYMU|nr:16S rRNA (guanine(527)-N(7))-methyltransferase RsmG [Amycolatopsis mediterranei]ADJ51049.1 glucose inhibited division protein B [Amycolatopsis mediterranei U32]AEK48065.1 glucose inhibited division protein B [Amycolatopsis mediterranei S699]AFO82754.1 glucose inhibited division protein B [Amycolatopsis mediterranei S699]AGT89884.1 glucose inhibited division protein B [Amycolatopsis mediterranei RB]KDO11955.1 16S rRNA methyltransferase [Amycolatopsis mediterranei]